LAVVKAFGGSSGNIGGSDNLTHLNTAGQEALTNKLDTPAKMFAALQYLSITTGNANAKNALSSDKFQRLSADSLATATAKIASLMPKGQLSKKDTEALVNMILSRI
jgi:hypothetical protein